MAEQATEKEKDYIFNKVKGMDLKKERNELQSIKKNNNMKSISLDITKAASFLNEGAVKAYEPQAIAAREALENGTCPGNDFLGWLHLPSSITPEFIDEIQAVANTLREKCECVVVAGIGGSYLGARAVIEALGNAFSWLVNDKKNPTILFAGNNIGEDYLYELTQYLKDKKFGVINISKSGTTTETALTFRLLKKQCEAQRGKEEAKDVIVAVTDAHKGAARAAATKEGYKTFVIPDNVGGRFSVLTPVGLLPIAVAGFDVKALVQGAADMATTFPSTRTPPLSTLLCATHCMHKLVRRLRLWLTSSPNCTSSASGGNSCMARAKAKTARASSPLHATSLPTFTQWVSGYRRASALSSKPLSALKSLTKPCCSLTTKRTSMV